MKLVKKLSAMALVLIMVLALLPMNGYAAEDLTMVEDYYNFTEMDRYAEGSDIAANKASVKKMLEEAGLYQAENLMNAGNMENILNPGGYCGEGFIIHKVDAAPGETIHNAMLSLGYWICTEANQGYVRVLVSADNVNYEQVWECAEGNGKPFENSRRSENITLPFAEGQTTIYVKVVMQHWSTYEGAGIAFSNVTLNVSSSLVESDLKPEECTVVTESHNFNGLAEGEVDAADIGAVDEKNMFYGVDGVLLLSSRNAYEAATATWLLEAAEGEPLHDAVLTIVGRTYYQDEVQKDNNYLKVFASTDGVIFTEVHKFQCNDNPDDTQRLTVDLTDICKGYGKVYVKMEWMVYDSPHILGIRSVSITGNTSGKDASGESAKMVITNIQSFTSLPVGNADADALGAFKAANLTFGYNKTPLLTQVEAGEDAYATWKLTAADGETFDDCYLTLVGRFGYTDASLKDGTSLKVTFSGDGEKYTEVKEILPTEDQSDTQVVTVNLSARAFGLSEIYVRVYWRSEDDPAAMGLRSMSLIANAGADYEAYLPELEDRVITDEEIGGDDAVVTPDPQPTESKPAASEPAGTDSGEPGNNSIVWIIVSVAVVAVIAVVVVVLKKKSAGKAAE